MFVRGEAGEKKEPNLLNVPEKRKEDSGDAREV